MITTKPLLAAAVCVLAGCGTTEESGSPIAVAASAEAIVDESCRLLDPDAERGYETAAAVYACIRAELLAGYRAGDKQWIPPEFVQDYRKWTPASRLPADPGVHGGRYLLTWVNETGAAEYLRYADPRGPMPAGTLIAKESFAIAEDGTAQPGPLFIMLKTEPGVSPRTDDWYYMAVAADGTPMAVNVFTACNECHSRFADADQLGYPVEEARIGG